jgi:hypothetical protein
MRVGSAVIAVVTMLSLAAGCEELGHVGDYKVEKIEPAPSVCTYCPLDAGDLRHPPCPTKVADVSTGAGVDPRYVFAWRRVSIGAEAALWTDQAFDQGLDLDCSPRTEATGAPVACIPPPLPDPAKGAFPVTLEPWVPLPHGIDNGLGLRVLGTLATLAKTLGQSFDVDQTLSDDYEHGKTGELVVIDDWNGTPNDPNVHVRFAGSKGTEAPPNWDGKDRWIPNSAIDRYASFDAYVAEGVLVVDTRGIGEDDTTISVTDSNGNQYRFELKGRLMIRTGLLTQTSLTLYTAGRWNLADALQEHNALVALLAQGDSTVESILQPNLDRLLYAATDLPLGSNASADEPCRAISFGVRSTAERGVVTNVH